MIEWVRGPGRVSLLKDISKAAYRAADRIQAWHPKNKHLRSSAARTKAKFNTDDFREIRDIVEEALRSERAMYMPNQIDGTFRVVTDIGRIVGVKGQTSVRVIVGLDGRVINAFPVHNF